MIINTSEVKHIYLANNYVDLRNSIDGLALIGSMQFDRDVMDGSIFKIILQMLLTLTQKKLL